MRHGFSKLAALVTCSLCFSATTLAAEQEWYFVRHFEKMSGDNPGLSELGRQRAQKLVEYFADTPLTTIYSSDYNRTKQTAQNVAKAQGLVTKLYNPSELGSFAIQLKLHSNILVVGHSNTTPELISLMGGKATALKESDYGQLFIVTKIEDKITTRVENIGPH